MLTRLRASYFRWAQPYYDKLPPLQREEARRFDESLYSWRGALAVLSLLMLAALMAGALASARDKPFLGMFWPMVQLVFSATLVILVGWFSFWKLKGKLAHFGLLLAGGAVLGGYAGYLAEPLLSGELSRERVQEALIRTTPFTLAIAVLLGLVVALVILLRSREDDARRRALQLDAERERAARLASEAELRALQAQIEPHFLFNTLSSAQYLSAAGDPRAADLLAQLNQFLRGTLEATRRRSVTLGDELELVRNYLAINELRLGGRIAASIDVPDAARPVDVPPAALLTLVENAIEHGIDPAVNGGALRVVVHLESREVRIEVSNTGEPLRLPISEGVGLSNLRQRLALLCGDGARFELAARDDGSTVATLIIPRRT